MHSLGDFFKYRGRTLAAGAAGMAAGLIASRSGLALGAAGLTGWNVAAVLFLLPTGKILLFDGPAEVRERAGREDENRAVMMSLIIAAVVTSLGGIVLALHDSKGAHASHPAWLLALSISTLVFNWLIVQSLFALHYAHRYFGDRDNDGTADEGFVFQGDKPDTYRDFVYVAICMGATCQVSDFSTTNAKFRNLVSVHAIIAFVFNTMVLALGINIIGNLMGQ
ncbi:MAG: DUF1345 domain-containing protein [Caulobacteraceae bacterium]